MLTPYWGRLALHKGCFATGLLARVGNGTIRQCTLALTVASVLLAINRSFTHSIVGVRAWLPVMGVRAGSRRTQATQLPADHVLTAREGGLRSALCVCPGLPPGAEAAAAGQPSLPGRRRWVRAGSEPCRGAKGICGLGTVRHFAENKIKQGMCIFLADRLLWCKMLSFE